MRGILKLFLLLWIFCSCGSKKDTASSSKKAYDPAPSWVSQRPHDAAYYIGLGSSSKKAQPLDYQAIAKKNALNDMATEISVRVQGETTMNTQEYNKAFSEDFMSSIKTTTDAKIEDYEVVGVWENEIEYWVFYRLNKSQYQSKKQEKKRQALSSANDFLIKGKLAESNGNINGAFDMYMHGLFSMKEYWAEQNEFTTESGKVFLDNELVNAMRNLFSELRIDVTPKKIVLSPENHFRMEALAKLTFRMNPARGVPVTYSYERETFMKPKSQFTSDSGELIMAIEEASSKSKNNQLKITIDPEMFLAEDLDKVLQKGLIKGIRIEQTLIPIEFVTPTFYVNSEEMNFSSPAATKVLANAFSSELQKRGVRTLASIKDANYVVSITANTKSGGSSDGFVVVYLDSTIEVKEIKSGAIVYKETLSGVKGVGINEVGASNDAYKRGREKIEQQILPALWKILF